MRSFNLFEIFSGKQQAIKKKSSSSKFEDTTYEGRNRLIITLLPGFDCNLKCKMCYNWKIPRKESLTVTDWVNLVASIDEIRHGRKVELSIGGGEPYLHNCIFKIIEKGSERGYRANISTNGFILNNSLLQRSLDAGLKGVSISLDSLNEEVHDKYRGVKGSFRRTMAIIDRIGKTKMDLSINTVLMAGNINDILPLARWVASKEKIAYNVQAVVEPFQQTHDENWFSKTDIWPSDTTKMSSVIDGLIELKKTTFKERMNNTIMQLELFKRYFANPKSFIKHKGCSLVDKSALTINPDGSVFICPFMSPVGNIKNRSIRNVIDSQETKDTIELMNQCTNNCHHLMNCYYQDE